MPKHAKAAIAELHGWTLFGHPCFLDQLERLLDAVEMERVRAGPDKPDSANAKVLAAITTLILEEIPTDPTRPEYRQGETLGSKRKHWFRAKFGGGRFRLFFRYRTDVRIIVYAWVNDEKTLRTYGKRSDAYAVFTRMLDMGDPPDSWGALLAASQHPETVERASRVVKRARRTRRS